MFECKLTSDFTQDTELLLQRVISSTKGSVIIFIFKRMCPLSIAPFLSRVQGTMQKSFRIITLVPTSPAEAGVTGSVNSSLARLASQDGHHSTVQTEARLWSSSRTKTEKGKKRRSRSTESTLHTQSSPSEGNRRNCRRRREERT